MRVLYMAAAGMLTVLAAGCSPASGTPDAANVPESRATIKAQAAQACSGSGFPANGSVQAPGVPCYAAQGMTGGPPAGAALSFSH